MSLSPSPPAHDDAVGDSLIDGTITDEELAAELNVGLQTIRRWAALGLLPPKLRTPGRTVRRSRAAIRRMMFGEAGSAPSPAPSPSPSPSPSAADRPRRRRRS